MFDGRVHQIIVDGQVHRIIFGESLKTGNFHNITCKSAYHVYIQRWAKV